MRCSVARLCERTVGRRVPLLGAGGGLLHTTPHCVVVTALGAELASCTSHTERRWVHPGAELRRYGKPHCLSWWGRERAEHFSGWQRCGAGELCEPHLPQLMTLQAASPYEGAIAPFCEIVNNVLHPNWAIRYRSRRINKLWHLL